VSIDRFLINKRCTLGFPENGDIFDLQLVKEISPESKEFLFVTNKGLFFAVLTKGKIGRSVQFKEKVDEDQVYLVGKAVGCLV
jgi:hypothetical protein